MKKVFISVGMRGRTNEEIKTDIDNATRHIRSLFGDDVEIVDNFVERPEGNTQRLYCLGESIKRLGECDYCYFCYNWKAYHGCNIEYNVCLRYGIKRLN